MARPHSVRGCDRRSFGRRKPIGLDEVSLPDRGKPLLHSENELSFLQRNPGLFRALSFLTVSYHFDFHMLTCFLDRDIFNNSNIAIVESKFGAMEASPSMASLPK